MYDYHSRSHSPRSPILARAVGRSSAVSPLPPSRTPPTSLPSTGLNAWKTLKPLGRPFSKERLPRVAGESRCPLVSLCRSPLGRRLQPNTAALRARRAPCQRPPQSLAHGIAIDDLSDLHMSPPTA